MVSNPRVTRFALIFSALTLLAFASNSAAALDAPAQPAAVALATPDVKHESGVVTITCSTPGALILYSLDKSDPDAKAGPYLAPIALPHGGIVKARAFTADHKQKSALAEAKIDPIKAGEPAPPSTTVAVTQGRQFPGYDWAKRHAAICATVNERQPKLIFIGDSITHFFGGEPVDIGKTGTAVWKKYYDARSTVDLGYGWDRTENVLWRLREGNELQDTKPKAAVIMIGTNNMDINTVPEIAEGVRLICEQVHQRSEETKILLLGIFPRGPKPDAKRKKIEEINAILAKLDGQKNVTYLDIGPKFLDAEGNITKDIMNDFLHPTLKGYGIWAEAMEPTLAKLLGDEPVKP
ncbi:MAG: GDSL-type esterase/lipase family protein [Planctomycetota bacterium]